MLTITSLGLVTESGLQSVRAKGRWGPVVSIGVRRIHSDGKPRRNGFDLLPAQPHPLASLVGREVRIVRGSPSRLTAPGHERRVRARLDRVDGEVVFATLLEDDPAATVSPFKAGETGAWHGLSFVEAPAG